MIFHYKLIRITLLLNQQFTIHMMVIEAVCTCNSELDLPKEGCEFEPDREILTYGDLQRGCHSGVNLS